MQKSCDDYESVSITLPAELENVKLPNPQLMEYYRQKKNRVLSLYDGISEDSILPIIEDILNFNEDDKEVAVEARKPIILRISSAGGDAEAAMSLANVVQLSKTPITIINMCDCYSAAFLIIISAKKRMSVASGNFMWHSGSLSQNGTVGLNTMFDTMDFLKRYEKIYETYIIGNTKIDKKTYTKIKKDDFFMTAQDALELGVIDEIITDISQFYND